MFINKKSFQICNLCAQLAEDLRRRVVEKHSLERLVGRLVEEMK